MYYLKLKITKLVLARRTRVSCIMADYIFRLKDTSLGTLLVKFYQVGPYSSEAFEWLVQRDFLKTNVPSSGGSWGSRLYQGEVDNAFVLPEDIFKLHLRCPHCNCLHIERTDLASAP